MGWQFFQADRQNELAGQSGTALFLINFSFCSKNAYFASGSLFQAPALNLSAID